MLVRSQRILPIMLVAPCLLLSPESGTAEPALELYIRDTEEILQGDPIGTSIDADGRISLGLTQNRIYSDIGHPVVRMVFGKKKVYLGTAGKGLLAYDLRRKTVRTLFAPEDQLISALALDGKYLWFATGPNGRIYRWNGKKAEAWLAPEDSTYIWDLLPQPKDGSLLVATGNPGRILRARKGKAVEVFAPEESHIRVLHQHPQRGLIAGGGSTGIVYQVDDNGARALYDSGLEEVTAMVSDRRSNNLYVALISSTDQGTLDPGTWIGPVGGETPSSDEAPIQASEVVRIRPNGEVNTVWTSNREGALGLHFDELHRTLFIAATGYGPTARARIYTIEPEARDRLTVLARMESPIATAMAPHPADGALWVTTAPTGDVWQLGPELRTSGVYESVEQDLRRVSEVGRLWFDADLPTKSRVQLQLRTGNTQTPDGTWSEWSASVERPAGADVQVPNARYAQFRVTLSRTAGGAPPRLRSMHASVRRNNLPPKIDAIYPLKSGVYLKPIPTENEREKSITLSGSTLRDLRRRGVQTTQHPRARAGEMPGYVTIVWEASDPNGDPLLYAAHLVDADGTEWKLGEKLKLPFVSFDAKGYPDGPYTVKVVASDRIRNAPATTLSDERTSDVLVLDHSPPLIDTASVKKDGRSFVIRAEGRDSLSRIIWAEVSIDGEPWIMFPAKDGLIDARREQFQLRAIRETAPKSVKIRIQDAAHNQATLSAPLRY